MIQLLSIPVIEVSSGEYGPHVDRMMSAIDNGRNQKWRDYTSDAIQATTSDELEIEQLNTGGVEKHGYKYGSTACQQFGVLLKRMTLQTLRNRVRSLLISALLGFGTYIRDCTKAPSTRGVPFRLCVDVRRSLVTTSTR